MIKNMQELIEEAKKKGPKRCIVAAGDDEVSIKAVYHAKKEGIAEGVLFGKKEKIESICSKENIPIHEFEIIDAEGEEAVELAVKEAREHGDFLMKGKIQTSVFLKGVLSKEYGLRTGRVLSHVAILEPINYGKLLLVTDGGMNIAPDLSIKIDIIKNAIEVAKALGIKKPKVALLSAVEIVNPKMPDTMEWAEIVKMTERGQIEDAFIDGPLALDLAVSKEAAEIKGVGGNVVGNADILVVPDIAAGNIFAKGLIYLGKAKACGIIAGAFKPVVMLSRADTTETKLYSIALGALMGG